MSERARRDRKDKLAKLAEYKKAREGGGRTWKDEEEADLYDVVTEDQYKSIVKGRLQKDDFVEDDGVDGYMDNGMDDWTGGGDSQDEEEEHDRRASKKTNGKSKSKPKAKAPPPPAPAPIAAYRPAVSVEQESDFMSALLGDMDTKPVPAASKHASRSRKRKPSPSYRYTSRSSSPPRPAYRNGDSSHDPYSDAPSSDGFDNGFEPPSDYDVVERVPSPRKRPRTGDMPEIKPAIEKMGKMDVGATTDEDIDYDASFDEMDMSSFMEVDEEPTVKVEPKPVDLKPSKPAKPEIAKEEEHPSWLSVYDSLAVAGDESFGTLNTATATAPQNTNNISALEPDGSFRFFWLDYLEHEGVLYFIGKTLDKTTKAWVSCCVTVNNLQRNLFVLPREKRLDGEGYETDVVPGMKDVYSDFDQVRKKAGIKTWKAKFVKRKYAFGVADVPKEETSWLKVVYGFDEPQIPTDVTSPNFSRVFGSNTSAFELLVIKRRIMGPCWIKVQKPHVEHQGASWCKMEVTVNDPKDFNPFSETDAHAPKDMPPLTVASLSVRTIVNHAENIREIVCVTARIWSNFQIEDGTPPEQLPCSVHTLVRPLERFPPNFENVVRSNGKGTISAVLNERMLLSSLLLTLHKADPDVVVGHEFLGVSLDVLLHRMRELKVDHWSRLGRFRRVKWPNIGRQGTNIRFLQGRLLCDLGSDAAKSMISSTTWALTEMCKTHLKVDRQDIDADETHEYFDFAVKGPEKLVRFVRHCELDAHLQMALACKVQMLPLTRQLTNLAGNSWNKTLNGGRAERNEYILLHEFHRLKYICPDKQWGRKAAQIKVEVDEDGEETGKKSKNKKDKYKGGLVFEPKRGLWDKYILVMDFNSLYPSIIQEYNIDFTTIDRPEAEEGEEEKIPEPPEDDVPQGVLPRLIATLVNRRRQVKSLMKDRSLPHAKLLQFDIKQQALKLTANSMYGCLGFEGSRFFARPLAALTTFKGREILTNTRELAESLQLDVIYGDTDSLFVNSNVTELSDALKISAEFKKAVNERYKLLEIDLDGVFQRLLLLQKKKYAAIKVEDGTRTTTEVKGLDMKRREYCALSKSVSQYVLDQILSGEPTEVVVENIHEYLTTLSASIRTNQIKVEEFIIFKRLGKNPKDYPDAKSQPHVQVAFRMKERLGVDSRAGDVIPYIFCLEGKATEGSGGKTGQAERARHPEEIKKAAEELKIDYEYYLANQILPPVERLCDPIEGTDRARLAECLGLDPGRYRHNVVGEAEERYFGTLDSQVPDSERYKDAEPFIVRCRHCEAHTAFSPIGDRDSSIVLPSGPTCPACKKPFSTASLQVQLETEIRKSIARYYEAWTVCDDPTCGNRTRQMAVYGRRCLKPGCRGKVAFEFSDAEMYNQLRYLAYLFDVEKAAKAATGKRHDEIVALGTLQADFLQRMSQAVEKYLDRSGRRWVDMGSLFSFMKI